MSKQKKTTAKKRTRAPRQAVKPVAPATTRSAAKQIFADTAAVHAKLAAKFNTAVKEVNDVMVAAAINTLSEYARSRKIDLAAFGGKPGKFGRRTPLIVIAADQTAIKALSDMHKTVDDKLTDALLGL